MDSLWELQTNIDSINTIRLIEIVKKYGFPSVDRLGAPVSAWLIFQHSPKNFWRELNLLIKKESRKGNIPIAETTMLKWHLNGRKGIPFIPGIDGID